MCRAEICGVLSCTDVKSTRFYYSSTYKTPIIWVFFSMNKTSNKSCSLLYLGNEASLSSPVAPGPLITKMRVSIQRTIIRLVSCCDLVCLVLVCTFTQCFGIQIKQLRCFITD